MLLFWPSKIMLSLNAAYWPLNCFWMSSGVATFIRLMEGVSNLVE
jgi:hypothetical protein